MLPPTGMTTPRLNTRTGETSNLIELNGIKIEEKIKPIIAGAGLCCVMFSLGILESIVSMLVDKSNTPPTCAAPRVRLCRVMVAE